MRFVVQDGGDLYDVVCDLYDCWFVDGIVVCDDVLSFYFYVIELVNGGRCFGFCVFVGVDLSCDGDLCFYEYMVDKLLVECFLLLKCMCVDFELVFYFFEDFGELEVLFVVDVDVGIEFVCYYDVVCNEDYVFYCVIVFECIVQYKVVFEDCGVVIVDGYYCIKVF